jgi:putative membrane-bound dehydrogenase-like protein
MPFPRPAAVVALWTVLLGTAAIAEQGPHADLPTRAQSPEESLRCLKPRPGFDVELVAAEPLVQDPIAFAWGPDGKLWVVEMGDYPLGADNRGKPGGRVKYLEDINGDGKYDRATVFLDGLKFPSGLMPWRNGVLVACAPAIFYAEATRGSGPADRRVPLFVGFDECNPQHRVNSLSWGLDNWVHGAVGAIYTSSGRRIKSTKTGATADIPGRDFRFRPDDGWFDPQTGQTQFGRCRDDWGDAFGCNNTQPMFHFVLADHYLRRNPYCAVAEPRVQLPFSGLHPLDRATGTPRRASRQFTAACGLTVYRDGFLGPEFTGNAFVCDPVYNAVHREVLTPAGVTFTSRRAAHDGPGEFLASTDAWFRPTWAQTGPDGALWVCDMYRHMIEHPDFIPKDVLARVDVRAGHDKGRIYRVFPAGKRPQPIPRLDRLSTAELVAALDSPNGWQRDRAQQLLVWRQDKSAVPLLEKRAVDSERPLCRLHALCTLDGLHALTPALVRRALRDPHPGVRRHAVRLCEPFLTSTPDLGESLPPLAADSDAKVRMQLAYTLGAWDDPRAGAALGQLATRAGADPYLTAAILSSVHRKGLGKVVQAVTDNRIDPAAGLFEGLLRTAHGLKENTALAALLERLSTGELVPWKLAALAGLQDVFGQPQAPLAHLDIGGNDRLRVAAGRLQRLFERARALAQDAQAPEAERLLAVRLLGRGPDQQAEDRALLAGLLEPQASPALRVAAVDALGRLGGLQVPELLLRGWTGYGPDLRGQVLDVLLRRPAWAEAVAAALEQGRLPTAEIDAPRRQHLLEHPSPSVRQRVGKALTKLAAPDRQKIIRAYQPALALKGDAKHGEQVFRKTCATCHPFRGVGFAVGPDLATVVDKEPEWLLTAMLDPNQAVDARYLSYVATTKNGLLLSGLLANESGNSITLKGPDGKQQTILRGNLDDLVSSGKSLMPEGLEKELPPQAVADLIAYLRAGGQARPRRVLDGNRPEVVRPTADGALSLTARNGEIFGRTIVLDPRHGILSRWDSEDDVVAWSVDVPRPVRYAVWLDWACPERSAGNTFVLRAAHSCLTGRVADTGGEGTYRQAKVGAITLQAGPQQLSFEPLGKLSGRFLSFRSIRLTPSVK